MWHWFHHFFLHYTGSDNPAGPWYGFWSGFGSDLGEATLPIGLAMYLRHKNCHVAGCWRLGLKKVEGTDHVVCHKHHPQGKAPTHQEVLDDYKISNLS